MIIISPSSYVSVGDNVYVRCIHEDDGDVRRFKWCKGLVVHIYKDAEIEEVKDSVTCDIQYDDGECAIETVLYDRDYNNISGLDCWKLGDTMTKMINDLEEMAKLVNDGGAPGASAAIDFNTFANVGPGTANPSCARIIAVNDGNLSAHITFSTKLPGGIANALAERVRILSGGNVGIGTASPGYKLEVTGAIYASGDITALSDARLKENIQPIDDALTKLNMITGYTYTRKDADVLQEDVGTKHIGLIAQEVKEVLPEVVSYDKENDRYGVQYGNIVAVLIQAVKELKGEVDMLRN